MSASSFKNSNERNFKLWLFFVLMIDKQQIFWKKLSRIFVSSLFILKFLWVFEMILYSSAELWFITRFTFYNLTTIIQLSNILIHFNPVIISRDILYALTVTKVKLYIIEDVIVIFCILISSFLSIETKCIFFSKRKRR